MFIKAYSRVGDVEPFVYPKGAAGLSLGMAANLTGGALAKCAATTKPTHIIMGPQRADGTYPAIEVTDHTVFETVSTATVAATVVGSAVTLSTDALGVTATTNSTVRGVFVTPAA